MNKEQINKIKNAPPKYGISGEGRFLKYGVMVLMYEKDGEYRFILEKRSEHVRQKNEISFPGGKFETGLDNTTQDTALRETSEELGISAKKIDVICRVDSLLAPFGAFIDAYVGVLNIKDIAELKLNDGEVSYIIDPPVSFFEKSEPETYYALMKAHPTIITEKGDEEVLLPAKDLGLPEMYTKPWGGTRYDIYVYKYEREVIWGITARFIHDFVTKAKFIL
ncbi:MAG TPA: CoA pyrophosphatase [Ignavibacteriales bacterium]|nr:CoA pyrophosphatase [Ignavibacteriales bacterium]